MMLSLLISCAPLATSPDAASDVFTLSLQDSEQGSLYVADGVTPIWIDICGRVPTDADGETVPVQPASATVTVSSGTLAEADATVEVRADQCSTIPVLPSPHAPRLAVQVTVEDWTQTVDVPICPNLVDDVLWTTPVVASDTFSVTAGFVAALGTVSGGTTVGLSTSDPIAEAATPESVLTDAVTSVTTSVVLLEPAPEPIELSVFAQVEAPSWPDCPDADSTPFSTTVLLEPPESTDDSSDE